MAYPRLEIFLDKIRHNSRRLTEICNEFNIEVVGVNKVSCGSKEIAQAMLDGGVQIIADSRIENLEMIQEIKATKMLLRLPMISKALKVVELADISLNSEIKTIRALSEAAESLNKIHKIILMVDVGDLREGIFNEKEIMEVIEEIIKLEGVQLIGLGTNLSCFGGVIPSDKNLNKLVNLKTKIKEKFGITLDILSGGNSSSISLIQQKNMPKEINQLRLGTSIILGTVEINNTRIDNTYIDAFRLVTEIVEVKEKPSKPIGKIGKDAFGKKPYFEDRGIIKRAICAIGKQDINIDWMWPEEKEISILGGSSDHLIVDITDSLKEYDVGDEISFTLDYVAALNAMTSPYVHKVYK
ncbi:MAG: alanine/ornithine racemase family PLP-dependent enzyme [Firmicutes bacterium]|nr:alanine/ornithine racemase family PLP-dependent enzyme [Bacillota bacterium]